MKKGMMKKVFGACALSFCLGLFSFAPAQAAEDGTTTAIVFPSIRIWTRKQLMRIPV